MTKVDSLKISISGVRGIVGEALTPQLLTAFAGAFGTYIGRGPIIVGRDTRRSGEMVRNAVFAGLMSAGCEPVDVGICPVPSIQIRTVTRRARGAIAITASHNPVEWNALKFINFKGHFLSPYQAEELLDIYHQRTFAAVPSSDIPAIREDDRAVADHLDRLLRYFDVAAIRRAGLRVAIDCCNGAGSLAAPRFLRLLGCRVTELHSKPNGCFPHNPEPIPEHLGDLRATVRRETVDVGFAQDADADRLAVIDARGRPIGEDYTLALAVSFVLGRRAGPVVTNLSTTRAIDDIAAGFASPVTRTRIGEIHVVQEMIQSGAVIGGEGNGGVIIPEVHHCRDSMTGMGAVLQLMAERRQPLHRIVAELPRYQIVKAKVPFPMDRIAPLLQSIGKRIPADGHVTLDGLKLVWADSWLLVRPSNTEPVLRIVAESPMLKRSKAMVRVALTIVDSYRS